MRAVISRLGAAKRIICIFAYMTIGFDAKRIFQNDTGLGNYSRSLVTALSQYYAQNQYKLFAPKLTNKFRPELYQNVSVHLPQKFIEKKLKAAWRSKWMLKNLITEKTDVYHGLSFELPLGIEKSGIGSVVTVHDLIFERYPHQYKKIDRAIYKRKTIHACKAANRIIAISKQTRQDLIDFYNMDAEKIDVCYQSCNPAFAQKVADSEKQRIRQFYRLPERFFLVVGSIIERKNLLTVCKALKILKAKSTIPLVVIGNGKAYKQRVKNYIEKSGLVNDVIFLSEDVAINAIVNYKNGKDFPAIYQLATALIYSSVFEGFGIPITEAMSSGLPVITTNVSCMPETAGNAALYFNPFDEEQLAQHLWSVSNNEELRHSLIEKGYEQAKKFSPEVCASAVMDVYKKIYEK